MASYHARVSHVLPGWGVLALGIVSLGLPLWLLVPGALLVLYIATPTPTWEGEPEPPRLGAGKES